MCIFQELIPGVASLAGWHWLPVCELGGTRKLQAGCGTYRDSGAGSVWAIFRFTQEAGAQLGVTRRCLGAGESNEPDSREV